MTSMIVMLLLLSSSLVRGFDLINEILDQQFKYSILIDAGSTGSRIYLYRFSVLHQNNIDDNSTTVMNKIADSFTEISQYRVHPAMSSFVNDLRGLSDQINDMLRFAKLHINESYWNSTFVSLKATAGLRSLNILDQKYLMDNAYVIISGSDFNCRKSEIRVITGNEEALYAYIATITAFSSTSSSFNLNNHNKDSVNKYITRTIAGFSAIDMGGSSKQLAFIIPANINLEDHEYCEKSYIFQLPKLLGNESIYADSFVGKGLIAIMEHVLDVYLQSNSPIDPANETCSEDNIDGHSYLLDESVLTSHPCLSPSSVFSYNFLHRQVNMTGSGDFDKCVDIIRHQIIQMNQIKCIKSLQLTSSINKIIGMDNIPKILEMLHISIDSTLSPHYLSEMGRINCRKPWEQLLSEFPTSYPSYRAERACFGASYIYILMTEIFEIEEDDVTKLLPLETFDKFTLSWPLGAVIVDSLDYLLP